MAGQGLSRGVLLNAGEGEKGQVGRGQIHYPSQLPVGQSFKTFFFFSLKKKTPLSVQINVFSHKALTF